MNKVSQKVYQFPLQEKITILGSRVTTSAHPNYTIHNNQLILTDNWVIQLIYTIPQKVTEPKLLEFQSPWEEVWPWDNESAGSLTVTYKKRPQIQLLRTTAVNPNQPVLTLIIESYVDIAFNESLTVSPLSSSAAAPKKNDLPEPEPSVLPEPLNSAQHKEQSKLALFQQSYQELEENYYKVTQALEKLEQRLKILEEKQSEEKEQPAKLTGFVVDSFRLAPIAKAILELYQSGSEEPLYKLATNNQGYFSYEGILAGTYDIKVRHPRYQPLVMKNYPISSGENKNQDFILKRMM